MSWLLGLGFGAAVASFVVTQIIQYALTSLSDATANTVKAGVFITTWTAFTTSQGMRSLTNKVRGVRRLGRKH